MLQSEVDFFLPVGDIHHRPCESVPAYGFVAHLSYLLIGLQHAGDAVSIYVYFIYIFLPGVVDDKMLVATLRELDRFLGDEASLWAARVGFPQAGFYVDIRGAVKFVGEDSYCVAAFPAEGIAVCLTFTDARAAGCLHAAREYQPALFGWAYGCL